MMKHEKIMMLNRSFNVLMMERESADKKMENQFNHSAINLSHSRISSKGCLVHLCTCKECSTEHAYNCFHERGPVVVVVVVAAAVAVEH